jgi:hypothetical protein
MFPLVFCQEISIRLPLSLDFWLVMAGFFVLKSTHSYRFDDGFDWIRALNSKLPVNLAKTAEAGEDRPFNSELMTAEDSRAVR